MAKSARRRAWEKEHKQRKRAARKQEIAENRAIRRREQQKRRDARATLNERMGTAARLAVARRGLATFVAWALLGIGMGSLDWYLTEDGQKIPYSDAFKRAYNIENVANENARYAAPALILLAIAVIMGTSGVKRDKYNAESLIRRLERAKGKTPESGCYDDVLEKLKNIHADTPIMFMRDVDSVCRAIIRKYAAENPAMFEHVLRASKHEYITQDYINAVATGHLARRPADYARLLSICDKDSLSPLLVAKYGEKKR